MLGPSSLARIDDILNRLSSAAWADFEAAFAQLPAWDQQVTRRALEGAFPELLDRYGTMSASFGADVFDDWAQQVGIRPKLEMVAPVDPERAAARARWALSTDDVAGNLRVLTDELVKQPYRSTLAKSAVKSGAGWARVAHGDTCPFCVMLASRGGIYHSEAAAQRSHKFHGGCDCSIALVRGPEDYPDGYDPDALYARYRELRAQGAYGARR